MGTRLISDYSADKVERTIEERILTGRYRKGDRLPGFDQLAEEFGVSHPTLSKAIGRLKARRLVQCEPGDGVIVNALIEFVGLDLLWPMISHCDEEWRRLVLICHFYEFIRPQFADWVERAALKRTNVQLEWLNHFILALEDRHRLECSRSTVGHSEYEIARVIAAATDNLCCTMVINPLAELFESDALVRGTDSIVAAETYRAVLRALRERDGKQAATLIESALWTREVKCIEELKKLGWTATGDPLTVADGGNEAA